jgi:thiol-disulfide isomerase/thioredoxin
VVERDDTPDQPIRTSDLQIHRVLDKAARDRQRSAKQLADDLLRAAWNRPGVFAGQAQQLDRLASRFGLASPRSHANVEEARGPLQEWQSRLDKANNRLVRTLEDLNEAAFRRFLAGQPQRLASLKPASLRGLAPTQRIQLGASLVAELTAFAQNDRQGPTQTAAKAMLDAVGKLAFRLKVRLAALDRMDFVLDSVAAAQHLEDQPQERAALDRLLACEDLVLPLPQRAWPAPAPLPALEDDLAQAEMILALTSVEDRARPSTLTLGEPVPTLDLVPYRGQIPTLGAGTPVLLFFWATWCKPCKAVVPDVLEVAARRNLSVLAIASETAADLDRFFATAPAFPSLVARDPEARGPLLLGVRVIPSLVLIDGQGRVASKIVHSPSELPEGSGEP